MQWIFSGVYGAVASESPEVSLGSGFVLKKPDDYLLSARQAESLTGTEWEDAAEVPSYLLYKHVSQRTATYQEVIDIFFGGMLALQVLKPVKTTGITFYGVHEDSSVSLSQVAMQRRPPMELRPKKKPEEFDRTFLERVPSIICSILRIIKGTNVELRNALTLLQLGLEHSHALIAGLLWVTGMDAIFDSRGSKKFSEDLCASLGASTVVFPDEHPIYQNRTVSEVALDLYTLRSKVAHGEDLRKAASNPKHPIDFWASQSPPASSEPVPYSYLLSEAAYYLLCRVLQDEINKEIASTQSSSSAGRI